VRTRQRGLEHVSSEREKTANERKHIPQQRAAIGPILTSKRSGFNAVLVLQPQRPQASSLAVVEEEEEEEEEEGLFRVPGQGDTSRRDRM